MTKPFKLRSGNSPVKSILLGGSGVISTIARVGVPKPNYLQPVDSTDDSGEKKKKNIKLKSTGVNIPTYGRKL
tara:strand:- start:521 stop:739 length:219 start_codon:yes stop_codon:yes gene_type:complete